LPVKAKPSVITVIVALGENITVRHWGEREKMRKRFLKWLIKVLLPHHHLQKDSPGRRRKDFFIEVDMGEVQQIVEGMGKEEGAE